MELEPYMIAAPGARQRLLVTFGILQLQVVKFLDLLNERF